MEMIIETMQQMQNIKSKQILCDSMYMYITNCKLFLHLFSSYPHL